MSADDARGRAVMLVHRIPDEDDMEEQFKPLQWRLILRLFSYTASVKSKLRTLIILTIIRSAQLPALVWVTSIVIKGPIARGDMARVAAGVLGYGILAVWTDGMFHFRQRYALEIGEAVVNRLRSEIFDRLLAQPMSFFHRMKLGRIISRVTSDIEALRAGIQDVAFVSTIQFGQMVFAAVVMAYCDWELFMVVAAMAPVLWLANNHFRM